MVLLCLNHWGDNMAIVKVLKPQVHSSVNYLEMELQRIMDLPNPSEEAKKKLEGTYMIVNGTLEYVRELFINSSQLVSYDKRTDESSLINVHTLEVFLPEAGLYPLNSGNIVFLQKVPKRQWMKSYTENYYKKDIIGTAHITSDVVKDLLGKKRQDIAVDTERNIWFWNKKIGYIKDSEHLVCSNTLFKQELIDWSRDAY
jgi:hypothetical protein